MVYVLTSCKAKTRLVYPLAHDFLRNSRILTAMIIRCSLRSSVGSLPGDLRDYCDGVTVVKVTCNE